MKIKALLLFCLFSVLSYSQIEDAYIFLTDKENVQESIDNPLTILTQAALDRKALHQIPIDERDVPVNENYITLLKAQPGITVLAKSKWFNAVYVRGNLSQIEDLIELDFVEAIEYANKTLNFSPGNEPQPDKFIEIETRTEFDYGLASNQIEMLAGDYLHQQGYTGEGMVIAFMDSGYPGVNSAGGFARMRDNGKLLGTYDFVERQEEITINHSHGTRTLSTAAGYIEDLFVGTAPDASYYLFRTEDSGSETPVEEAYWVEALERADSLGVHVVNTSLGYREYDNPNHSHRYQDLDGETTWAARGANIGAEKGMLLVNSAGNGGNSSFPWITTPADAKGIFTVGAVDDQGEYVSFSSIGPTYDGRVKPDVMAQGRDAYNINPNNSVSTGNGTSFSSPILAGLAACLWQANLDIPNETIRQIIRESAHLYQNPTHQMGYGIPNFSQALQVVLSYTEHTHLSLKWYPNPVEEVLYFESPESDYELHISNILGQPLMVIAGAATSGKIDVSQLPSGMYFLTIIRAGHSNSFKFLKK